MPGVKIFDVAAADRAATAKRASRKADQFEQEHGYRPDPDPNPKQPLSHYRIAPNNNTINAQEQLKELRARHIEDRRAETTPRLTADQRRDTVLQGMPTTPAEMQEWQMSYYDSANIARRAQGQPDLELPPSMRPAVQQVTPVSDPVPAPSATDELVRGLRQKLGLK